MQQDITQTTQTDLENKVDDFEVTSYQTDGVTDSPETTYINADWADQLGTFMEIPELNRAITALATWTAGKGYTTEDIPLQVQLDGITGWGEDTFTSLMINMIKVKKIGGDAFAEIIRDPETGELINLKSLDPGVMKTVVNKQGVIIRFEQISKFKGTNPRKFKTHEILHLCNDRIADEIHGTGIIKIVQWVIDARKEAMKDWRRISHRATIRILYVDEDDKTRMDNAKTDYAEAINKGELLILPCKPGDAQFQDLTLPPAEQFLAWIRYLENFFYQAVGVPRVIATSEDYTESGSKVGFLTFEPVYTNEQTQLEGDLWNQVAIKIKFNRPPSLGGDLQRDEAKDAGQMGIQASDTEAGAGR